MTHREPMTPEEKREYEALKTQVDELVAREEVGPRQGGRQFDETGTVQLWYIERYNEHFIVEFYVGDTWRDKRVCADEEGPILFNRWGEAYNFLAFQRGLPDLPYLLANEKEHEHGKEQ